MECYICKEQFPYIRALFQHLRLIHGVYDGRILECGQGVCSKTFNTFSGYTKHLEKYHTTDRYYEAPVPYEELNEAPVPHEEFDHSDPDDHLSDDNDPGCAEGVNSSKLNKKDLEKRAAQFISEMTASAVVPEKCVNDIVDSVGMMISDIIQSASAAVTSAFQKHDIPTDSEACTEIHSHLSTLGKPFENLNSSFKRWKHCVNQGMVEPCELALGVRFENRLNPRTKEYEQISVEDTFMYVPVLKLLEMLLKHPDIFHHVPNDHMSTDSVSRDFCDGELFKENPLFQEDKNALQLHCFYDDFETVNPLGSKTSIHKLGAFYFVLKNLPPRFNSSLKNIHLIALCYSKDIKKYGFHKVLEPFIHDVNVLSTKGIQCPDGSVKKGTITQFSGDNLGIHSLFGFVESFSASHYCRMCTVSNVQAQHCFDEDDNLLRTKESFEEQVVEAEQQGKHILGIKSASILNECIYFHVLSNYAMDVMHDVLEGVVQYEVKLVLNHFINEITPPLFSLEVLNYRISSHRYGHMDQKDKPSNIKLASLGNNIGQKAMQSWCLIRHLPLLIGHDIEEDDRYWELLLKLLDCMDIIFSPNITAGLIAQLRVLIRDHHRHFLDLFPNKRLLPKHHFMVHYPRCLEKIGPLFHVWAMRYEAKHNYFCRVADSVGNYKNICKTVAKRHQQTQMHYLCNSALTLESMEIGPGNIICVSDLVPKMVKLLEQNVLMHVDEQNTEMYDAYWVKINGTCYRQSLALCYDVEDLPVFGKIQHCLIYNKSLFFILSILETLFYDDHYHAFSVQEKEPLCFVVKVLSELVDFKPLDVLNNQDRYNNNSYIIPRHLLFK